MSTISCPHCGTQNRAGSKFCNQCGVSLSERADAEEPANFVAPLSPSLVPQAATESADIKTEPVQSSIPRLTLRRPGGPGSRAAKPSPPPEPQAEPLPDLDPAQPWLRPEMDDADAATPPTPDPRTEERRLFAGLQGLLDPVEMQDPVPPLAIPQAPVGRTLDTETHRHLRTLAGSGMTLAEGTPAPARPLPPVRGVGWIALLIGLALGLPVLLLATSPDLKPHLWPGLIEAHAVIDQLAPGAPVLINWAYDPATAGEMDLVAQPVMEHLLARRAQLVVISQLPGGPATARQLFAQAATDLRRSAGPLFPAGSLQGQMVEGGFLPGGASVLPLLGQDSAETISGAAVPSPSGSLSAQAVSALAAQGPALSIIFAAQAEDVQEWLEQVQPLDGTPVIAVVSAGADPILRPYLDSGQLSGLVSGFDGAFNYSARLPFAPSLDQTTRLQVQAVAQDWGMWLILLLILAGNVRGLMGRGPFAPIGDGMDETEGGRGR